MIAQSNSGIRPANRAMVNSAFLSPSTPHLYSWAKAEQPSVMGQFKGNQNPGINSMHQSSRKSEIARKTIVVNNLAPNNTIKRDLNLLEYNLRSKFSSNSGGDAGPVQAPYGDRWTDTAAR